VVAHILLVHGPNLNLLGTREPEVYGRVRLADINRQLEQAAVQAGHTLSHFQSNHEGAIVDWVQQHAPEAAYLMINPGAFTHTSVAIRDAILAVGIPAIEVHLSNVHRREPFRRHSYLADICVGQVVGFGAHSYQLALQAVCQLLQPDAPSPSPS
jgi:3-dehydroquinate dehydratase-2